MHKNNAARPVGGRVFCSGKRGGRSFHDAQGWKVVSANRRIAHLDEKYQFDRTWPDPDTCDATSLLRIDPFFTESFKKLIDALPDGIR